MKHVLTAIPFAALLAVTIACGSDDEPGTDGNGSSGQTTSSSGSTDNTSSGGSSSGGTSSSSGGASSSGSSSGAVPFECQDAPFIFPADTSAPLAPSTYEDYLAVSSAFPFDVVGFYESPVEIMGGGVAWGEHGGLLTTEADSDTGAVLVHRLSAPATATGALTDSLLTIPRPASLPAAANANYPPVAALPGDKYLLSYTGAPVDGLFPSYTFLSEGATPRSEAFSNNFFGAAGSVRGDATRIFYHAFAPLAATETNTAASAMYATDIRGNELTGATASSFALVDTANESSGPIVKDGNGSILVATYVSADTSVNLRIVSRCAALRATTPVAVTPFHSYDAPGTSTVAVIPAAAGLPGYVVHTSFTPDALATPFTRTGEVFATAGADLVAPIAAGPDTEGLTVFADDKGYLWVGISTDNDSYLAKLRRRAN